MKILISWIGIAKDFKEGQVASGSPNYLFHSSPQYDFDTHIILFNKEDHQTAARLFQQKIEQDFKGRKVELRELKLIDERDLNEVQDKVGAFIKSLENHDITILISTGTSILKIGWYIFTSSFQQSIRLVQYRQNHKNFGEIKLERSTEPYALMVNEQELANRKNVAHVRDFYQAPALTKVYGRASKIALVDNTVLIVGDTGTGKELLAKHIHEKSSRKANPFIAVNCAAFSNELLSSELFGYVKGAFTDAKTDRKGIFEQAQGGTVFLDEIGDISPFMQQSLLRVLQEKKISRIGDAGKEVAVNVRVLAATNKDLLQKVTEGSFREDLYYRLAVNELELPSVCDWPAEEKLGLLNALIDKKSKELKLKPIVLSEGVKDYLISYRCPGNIRELENLISGLFPFRSDSPIEISDLPKRMRELKQSSLHWEEVEREHIKKVLKLFGGNQSKASNQIGYALNTFKDRIKRYGISLDDFKK